MKLQFDKSAAGRYAIAASHQAQVCTSPLVTGSGTYIDLEEGDMVQLTGWYVASDWGMFYYQTFNNPLYYAIWDNTDWKLTSEAAAGKSRAQAQKLVDGILKNNRQIVTNNLLCARFSHLLTKEERQNVVKLQQYVNERNDCLRQSGLVTEVVTTRPAGYSNLQSYLDRLEQSVSGAAVGSLAVTIIVSAIVIAATATAAWYAYKYYYDQSANHVKYSNELTKKLTSKLTEEEYQQLLQETNGIVTKAVIRTKLAGFGGAAKNLLLIALGAVAIVKLPEMLDKWRKS